MAGSRLKAKQIALSLLAADWIYRPIASTSCRQITAPGQYPPYLRVVLASALETLEQPGRASAIMPMPVSRTANHNAGARRWRGIAAHAGQ